MHIREELLISVAGDAFDLGAQCAIQVHDFLCQAGKLINIRGFCHSAPELTPTVS